MELPYNQAIPLWGIYSKELKAGTSAVSIPMFRAILLKMPKTWKQPSVHQWVNG
jgi:hypothetical protein